MSAASLLSAGVDVVMLEAGSFLSLDPVALEAFDTPEDAPFAWWRCRTVGGKLTRWGRHCLRFARSDFTAGSALSPELAWPVGYDDLAPHYERMERLLSVDGTAEGLPEVPDGHFLPRSSLPAFHRRLAPRVARAGGKLIPPRYANGEYAWGSELIKQRLVRDFRFSLVPHAIALNVELDPRTNRASGVTFFDALEGRERTIPASAVVVAAGAIESCVLLLGSTSRRYPDGIGNASGTLGKYVMDHVFVTTRATLPSSTRLTGEGSPHQDWGPERNVALFPRRDHGPFASPAGLFGGYQFQIMTGSRTGLEWTLTLMGFGEMLPSATNRVELTGRHAPNHLPIPRIECRHSDDDVRMSDRMEEVAREIARLGGAALREEVCSPPGSAIHQAGGCRMGMDPLTSMLDGENRSHEVRNLLVVDSSSFPTVNEKNPTLTIMALAWRASGLAAARLRSDDWA